VSSTPDGLFTLTVKSAAIADTAIYSIDIANKAGTRSSQSDVQVSGVDLALVNNVEYGH